MMDDNIFQYGIGFFVILYFLGGIISKPALSMISIFGILTTALLSLCFYGGSFVTFLVIVWLVWIIGWPFYKEKRNSK